MFIEVRNIDLPCKVKFRERYKKPEFKVDKGYLTIHFVESSLTLAFLREANTSKTVIDVFNLLEDKLGEDLFKNCYI